MGIYINPTASKETWLEENGLEIPFDEVESIEVEPQHTGDLPICLVQNANFSAAAVCFSQKELDRFRRPDGRPKRWYYVSIRDVATVVDPAFASEILALGGTHGTAD